MVLNCLHGKPLPLYGDGNQVRDWLFVGDHCRAIRSVLKHGRLGEVYNVGGDSEMNNKDVVHAICNTVDELKPKSPHSPSTSLITYVLDRPGHDRRYAIDFQKIQRETKLATNSQFRRRHHPDGSLVFGASRVGGKCSRWRIPKHSPWNSS